jgi:hypothetical protein
MRTDDALSHRNAGSFRTLGLTPPLPPMDEQNLRTRIRALIASGALPTDMHGSVASIEMQYRALPDERSVVCQETGPHILYTFREGKLVRLHTACDALWCEERPSS